MNYLCCALEPKVTCSACEQSMCEGHVMLHAIGLLNGSKFCRWFCPILGKKMYLRTSDKPMLIGRAGILIPHYEDANIAIKKEEDNEI